MAARTRTMLSLQSRLGHEVLVCVHVHGTFQPYHDRQRCSSPIASLNDQPPARAISQRLRSYTRCGLGLLCLHYYCSFNFPFIFLVTQNGSFELLTPCGLVGLFTCKLPQNFHSYDSVAV